MTHGFRIVPINEDFLRRARCDARDDLNQAVEYHVAAGGEPCRDVLRRAKQGEKLILASYCPFNIIGLYKEYGPVFILAEESDETVELWRFPNSHKNAYFQETFVLRAYSPNERIVDAILSSPLHFESDLQSLLNRAEVAFVLARFPTYGCYACRFERPI